MITTADLVIEGATSTAFDAAVDAARRGLNVIVVDGAVRRSMMRGLRRRLRDQGIAPNAITLISGAELVLADGVGGVEAVIVRWLKSGRTIGINTPRVLVTSLRAARLRTPALRSAE
jgi:hypothetical protein